MLVLQLPEEILLHIAKYLPLADLLCFSSVCKCFRRICFPLYHNLVLHLPNCDFDACYETWMEWKMSKVILDLHEVHLMSVSDLCMIMKQCSELEVINGGENWETIVLPIIENVEISLVSIKNSVCCIGKFNHQCSLRKFDLSFERSKLVYSIKEGYSNYEKGILKINKFCNKQSMTVNNCVNISEKSKRIDDSLIDAMLCYQHTNCTTMLSYLNLNGSHISDSSVVAFSQQFPNLKTLSLNNCSNLSGTVVNIVGKMSQLQHLAIAGLNGVRSIASLSNLQSLVSLDVSNCKRLNDITGIMEIITNFESLKLSGIPACLEILTVFYLENLKELDIQNCYQVSDSLLNRLKLPKLRSLNLSSCVRVTNEMLRSAVCRSNSIVELNLSWLKKITPSFFEETVSVSRLFWRVEKLVLSNMNITDNCLSIIQSCHPMSLLTLHVAMCKEITDKGLLKIALVPTIQDLDLSHLRNITDQGIKILANRLYRLKILKITGCICITDQGASSLRMCRHLNTLECTQCYQISNKAIETLSELLPKLKNILFVKKITVTL